MIGTTAEASPKKIYVPSVDVIDAFSSRKILNMNGVDYVVAKKGDNFRSLAQELQLGYWQLPKYNEMDENTSLVEGQFVYIQPKKSEGIIPLYIVKPGDTILKIAQENGIKIKYIYKYNNLSADARVEPGQQLFLKKSHTLKN